MGLTCVDSCIAIYAMEEAGPFGDGIRARLTTTTNQLVISPLVMLECLVRPLRTENQRLIHRYREFFAMLPLIEVGAGAYLRAAEVRAAHGLHTPDALHLTAAQRAGCTEFWTNDKRLAVAARDAGIEVVAL